MEAMCHINVVNATFKLSRHNILENKFEIAVQILLRGNSVSATLNLNVVNTTYKLSVHYIGDCAQ